MALTRRQVLFGGGCLVLTGGLTAGLVDGRRIWHHVADLVDPVPEPVTRIPTLPGGALVSGRFQSAARRTAVGWTIAYPPGADGSATLPVVLVLHGRGDDHRSAFDKHQLDRFLAATVDAGTPPFALASVDGGDHTYWHQRHDGDDPMTMLLAEFVPLLARRGLRTATLGLMGWSMGGYGALLVAERLGARRCAAVAVDSPALWLRPRDSASGAFDDAEDYRRNDVFASRARLTGVPVRIACGRSDPFYQATRAFAAGLPAAPDVDFSPGGHSAAFWRHSAQRQLSFLGSHLAAT